MKILFVFAHPAPYKIDLFNGLAPHIDLTVVFERHSSGFRHPYFYERTNYNFRTIFLRGISIGAENHLSFELIRHLKNNAYDLIVMNGYSSFTEILTIKYLQRKKRPYVLYVNGGVIHEDPRWRLNLKTKLVSGATHYFSPSTHVDSYLRHYGAQQEQIIHYPYATIYDGDIAAEKISLKQKHSFWKSLNIPDGPVFISAGQFIDRKNNIGILKIWCDRPQDNQLLLIGSGPDELKYQHFITEHKMKNVHIIPYQKRHNLLNLMRYATGFIILSKEDIYGHVINESLSQGLPVISSRHVMAALHLIKNAENGFLVDLEDTDAINNAITTLIKKDLFANCTATSRGNTIEKMVDHHLQTFANIKL
ncbi:MAG TPA: hypothetical protein DCX17_03670 [Firmicutes bacterium]|nr:hypothetical protein [Bacillota bacterium]